jgi:ABC-type tungstate transport system permease subunit
MHASDTVLNLVADGYAMDAQPWVRNDFVIVGPENDPAGIRGMTDAAEALRKIAKTKSAFVIHASLGAQEVLRNILEPNELALDPDHTTALIDDHQRIVLKIAADKHAYTLIGRIPFRSGKLPNAGLAVMVENDERLRRPFVVAVANPIKVTGARVADARMLAAFLRSEATQQWIAEFGKGKFDDRPLFFPVVVSAAPTAPASTQPTRAILSIIGEVPKASFLSADDWGKFSRHEMTVKDKSGKPTTYGGVLATDVLQSAGLDVGNHAMNRANARLIVRVEAADGFVAVLSVCEIDNQAPEHAFLLADRRDGEPLNEMEGPLRLVCPGDATAVRSVRQVRSLTITRLD